MKEIDKGAADFMPEIMDKAVLKALSTDTRQEMIKLLAKRPYTASELSDILNKHVTTITEHLNVLEKSGLIRKKESGNKWVYYALTDRGERIFKPTYYSWVIVLSLSLLCLLIGAQQIIMSPVYYGTLAADNTGAPVDRDLEQAVKQTTNEPLAATINKTNATEEEMITKIEPPGSRGPTSPDNIRLIIGMILIASALIGFSYLIIKKLRK